jgi:hypothetical protein
MSQFLTMPEASAHCGGVPSLRDLCTDWHAKGHLPVRRIGRRLVISERLLDQWIDSTGDVRDAEYPDARPRLKSVTNPLSCRIGIVRSRLQAICDAVSQDASMDPLSTSI